MYGDRHDLHGGDLAEFGKKRNTAYDFPPLLYIQIANLSRSAHFRRVLCLLVFSILFRQRLVSASLREASKTVRIVTLLFVPKDPRSLFRPKVKSTSSCYACLNL